MIRVGLLSVCKIIIRTMRRIILVAILVFFFLQFSYMPANASFGVSPADITTEYLMPGMRIEKEFLLSRTDLENDLKIVVEPEVEGANGWIHIEPSVAFTIPKGERTKKMKVVISIPKDASLRNYSGYIIIKALEGGKTEGLATVKGVGISVSLKTGNDQVAKLVVRQLNIPDVHKDAPIRLLMKIENQGNMVSDPDQVSLVASSLAGNQIMQVEDTTFESIAPGETRELAAEFENELELGEYTANIKIVFQGQELREEKLVFNIIETAENAATVPSEQKENRITFMRVVVFLLATLMLFLVIKLFKKQRSRHKKPKENVLESFKSRKNP